MAKRTKQGVGMTERVVIQHDQSDFSDAGSFAEVFFASLDANCIATNVRAENAERCQNILSAAGLVLGKIESERLLGKYGEDSPERLAADWLRSYRRMGALSEKALNGDTMALTDLIGEAEHLGILQERMWWRCGLDSSTGKRRESLALSGQSQVKAGQRGNEMRSTGSFAASHGDEAQALAHEIAMRNPKLSWTAIRKNLAAKYQVSTETIKKTVKNPKKVG
jgi:hypothetical protein